MSSSCCIPDGTELACGVKKEWKGGKRGESEQERNQRRATSEKLPLRDELVCPQQQGGRVEHQEDLRVEEGSI